MSPRNIYIYIFISFSAKSSYSRSDFLATMHHPVPKRGENFRSPPLPHIRVLFGKQEYECLKEPDIKNTKVSGWGVCCHDFRRLPIASCRSVRVSCPCVDALIHEAVNFHRLLPSPNVSRCLPMSTTRLSLLPNPHPKIYQLAHEGTPGSVVMANFGQVRTHTHTTPTPAPAPAPAIYPHPHSNPHPPFIRTHTQTHTRSSSAPTPKLAPLAYIYAHSRISPSPLPCPPCHLQISWNFGTVVGLIQIFEQHNAAMAQVSPTSAHLSLPQPTCILALHALTNRTTHHSLTTRATCTTPSPLPHHSLTTLTSLAL